MKANTTPKRIINLFQHPSQRFTDTVGAIADQRIAAAGIAGGGLKHAGSIDYIDANLLTADNVGKVYNVGNEFTVEDGDTIFVETVDQETTFPAGTNLVVVAVEEEVEDETVTSYKFDILPGLPSSGGGGVEMLHVAGSSMTGSEYDLLTQLISVRPCVKITGYDQNSNEIINSSFYAPGVVDIVLTNGGHDMNITPLGNAAMMLDPNYDSSNTYNVEVIDFYAFVLC